MQFLIPKHGNGMLLVRKLINGFALCSPIDTEVTGLLKHVTIGMYVPCDGGYYAKVSPLALRGILIGQPPLTWLDRSY